MYDENLKIKKDKSEKKDKKKNKKFSLPSINFDINYKSILKKFGILLLIVFVFIFITTKIGQRSENKIFEENLDTLKNGAYKYFQDNERPTEVDEEYNITLQELIDTEYINPLKDKSGNVCDADSSMVSITKKTVTKYDLVAQLKCNEKSEEKNYQLTFASSNNNSSNNTEKNNTYYKLQKVLNTDNYQYSCPDGYVQNGKYCYSSASVLTTNAVARYKTTTAKITKASYKKEKDEYEYVDVVNIKVEDSYKCSNSNAVLVGNQCVITKNASMKEDVVYSCSQGELNGKNCVITLSATPKNYKYKCSSGNLVNGDKCELNKDYRSSYSCPSDYPNRDDERCYYSEKADRDWGEWKITARKTYSSKKSNSNDTMYELVDTYEGSNGKTKYVYNVYKRSLEYICNKIDGEDVELKGSYCYYYINAYEDKVCPNGYNLNEKENECVKLVEASKVKANLTYTCPDGYSKKGAGNNTMCVKKAEAQKSTTSIPKCSSGYNSQLNDDGSYSCVKYTDAKLVEGGIKYVCPTGYEQKGSGENSKCYKKTTTDGYYYCRNSEARLEGESCIIEAKTEFIGYKCPSGYELNGTQCIKVLSGDKIKATKTNDPDIDVTYKWSDKKSESGWTWTGETKEL